MYQAWNYLIANKSAIDAVEAGCTTCEMEQCKRTVGFGGSPDENGETTLDAMIIDGSNLNVGAVAGLRFIKNAVSVARKVLDNTKHTLLSGNLATEFGLNMGFMPESLSTDESTAMWENWKKNSCQPNFWVNVNPDPNKGCGPYIPIDSTKTTALSRNIKFNLPQLSEKNHDTITMLAVDRDGNVAAGATTNGLIHKIPGRVGDTPVPGAGAYADNSIGAASATGDGDIMMRFLPSFLAVEEMRHGASPKAAAETAIKRISSHYPDFFGALIAVNIYGEFGAACHGMESFPYCVANPSLGNVTVYTIDCLQGK
ncbi:N(4)-(Beta-N-acetylglucosaminyl)-L-asparaginase-like isoform X2 [Lycorma delicatula]|uniref:N(4)-(Beta-N-acetylglucosaminyl)-L-asparaginase- like isoform X2 n=1 Tax=Lycorma delicatula TaxID=130591 RepID=UPI003F510DE2